MFPFKILEEKYRSIPDNVRQAISSSEVNQKLRKITDKYKLQFDEAEDLTKEIGFVMLGLKKPDHFIKNAQQAAQVDFQTAKKIVEDVNEIIFKGIKNSLKKMSQEKEKAEEEDEENFGAEQRQKIRDELIQEIENPTPVKQKGLTGQVEKTTDLTKKPPQELQNIKPRTEKIAPNASNNAEQEKNIQPEPISENNQQPVQQNQPKKYTIDPYREPIK